MRTRIAWMLITLAAVLAPGGCHAVPECVGNCERDTGGDEGEDIPQDRDAETVEGTEVPDGEAPDVPEVPDGETPDVPDGCTFCEYLFPNCIDGSTCCADPYGKETCNGLDDDCDGEVDEDINFQEDPQNCGSCGTSCRKPHAEIRCVDSVCTFVRCLSLYYDCAEDDPADPDTLGCEYYCVASPDDTDDSVCDGLDGDCDCAVDEGVDLTTDEDNCGACGTRCRAPHATSECFSPDGTAENADCRITVCAGGYIDLDGDYTTGCEYECTPCEYLEGSCVGGRTCCTVDGAETCNGVDDDCNGDVDEGNPGGGETCGTDVGACATGTADCVDGELRCEGDVEPEQETCDGADNDCDGSTDEPDGGELFLPDENFPCGNSTGDCQQGLTDCVAGTLDCAGEVGPVGETCDGHDNDCDGTADESPLPGEGVACGTDTGQCTAGTMACRSGGWTCQGETGPTTELCDGLDNDCNGTPDDPFDFQNDPNNCGSCGNRCSAVMGPHTIYICQARVCVKIGCEEGYWDLDANPNTCEYACTYSGEEICDGRDNDCDNRVDLLDPSMAPIANFCNQIGPCLGSTPSCTTHGSVTKWYCNYPSSVNLDTDWETILPETDCNDVDNDCDGDVDETFPLKGDDCSDGVGTCLRNGHYVCNAAHDNVVCDAVAGTPGTESCNGQDDNCDGVVDNFSETAWTVIGAVPVSGSGAQYAFQYESSRPDAAVCAAGTQTGSGTTVTTKPCSKTGVQPWADVDFVTAREACCNLNSDNICHYSGGVPQRWNLCTEPVWEEVCEAQGQNYSYPYGNTYVATSCNGNDYDTNQPCPPPTTVVAGDQDAVMATGAMTACTSTWGSYGVYDMSGNVKEWTYTERGTGYHVIRGGANNTPAAGMTCQFNFTLGGESFTFYNLGFRCCYY